MVTGRSRLADDEVTRRRAAARRRGHDTDGAPPDRTATAQAATTAHAASRLPGARYDVAIPRAARR
jgi:hypothetical protein